MDISKYKKVYKEIKKCKKIILARHIGPDPDALGSTLGLKEVIQNTFSDKEVYAVGTPASKHKYIGELDKFIDSMYEDSLLIVLDTPDIKRIDGVDPLRFKKKIKIDHHPIVDEYCDIEIVDEDASSAAELVLELIYYTKLRLNKSAAEKFYIGIIGDTNRFFFSNSSSKTFFLVSWLLKKTNIDITKIYECMYMRNMEEIKLQSYVTNNIKITKNKLGFLMLDQETIDSLNTDCATMTNIVNNLQYIDEMIVWVIFAYDKNNQNIRASVRSRGPIINDVAAHFNGGGHIYASGARLQNFEEAEKMVEELDLVCKGYDKG